jgi:hypothetical protein
MWLSLWSFCGCSGFSAVEEVERSRVCKTMRSIGIRESKEEAGFVNCGLAQTQEHTRSLGQH